jgi:hypothetical protein
MSQSQKLPTYDQSRFESWMKIVDALVRRKTGLSVYDLPDCPFRDWFDGRASAATAANRAVKLAKEEM